MSSRASSSRASSPVGDPDDAVSRHRRIRGRVAAALRSRVTRPVRGVAPLAPLAAAHRLRRRLAPGRYTDAPAFALRRVDPARIRRSVLETAPRTPQWGRVVGGDFDAEWEPFDERPVPTGLRQRYVEGRDWADTALVEAFDDQLARFGNAWGHTSREGFTRRCREIDRLYASLRDQGYRRQETLRGPDAYATTARLDEINVDVGRDGTLYWRAYGQHRLALAKLLGIESVPVLVHRRHASWQAIRDGLRDTASGPRSDRRSRSDRRPYSDRRSHPDLRDLVAETSDADTRGENS